MTENETVGWRRRFDAISSSKLRELVMDREAWWAAAHDVTESDVAE